MPQRLEASLEQSISTKTCALCTSRAHVLKPLTDLSRLKNKAKIKSTPGMETAFKNETIIGIECFDSIFKS